MWDQLPELILTQIFDYLNRTDRASVGQVCRSWNRTLSSPVLWRSFTVLIDRELRGDFPLAGELAVREFSAIKLTDFFQANLSQRLAYSRTHMQKLNYLCIVIKFKNNIWKKALYKLSHKIDKWREKKNWLMIQKTCYLIFLWF